MKVTFLGTGTSQGVPLIGCQCMVCQSTNEKDKRLRSSIMIESETTRIVIDTGPDFRQQMLRTQISRLDAVVFTHSHKDHVAGLDDIRAFNFIQQKPMEVFASSQTQDRLKVEFDYVFSGVNYPGIPKINLHTISPEKSFIIGDIELLPIEVMHHKMPVLGFRIKDFTYITDANYISPSEFEKLRGTKKLVLNALRKEKHVSHFTLSEALEIAKEIQPNATYFTHISHQLGLHDEIEMELPLNCFLAYDKLEIMI